MRKSINILILLCVCLSGFTQETDSIKIRRQPYIQLNLLTGSFWSRSEYLVEQFEAPYKAIEARFGYQLSGNKMWQQLYRYPKIGLGMHYSDLVKDRSDTIVGNPLSLFGFYSSPLARLGRFTLASDMGVGLSYTSLIHDFVDNPYNDVIASHINLYFHLDLNMNIKLTPRLGVDLGYGLTHYSNGRIEMPQKGVNNWGLSFGLSWLLQEPVKEFIYREPPEFKPAESIQVMYAVGVVEDFMQGSTTGTKFFCSSFTIDYVYQFGPKGAITFGMDVLYDGSLERAIQGVPPQEVTTRQKMYLGSHMGYHFIVDRFTLLFNFGTYYRQASIDRGFMFARIGGRYQITEPLSAHICIKTKQGVRSDWIEWGLAYSFKIR